jgi:transcriptional regulator with XRE-family HTH domain
MEDSVASLATSIGLRVRQSRLARRWTLDQLAEAAAVSRRMVVNVEQGAANPSVGTLLRLSDALGVGLPALVAPPEPAQITVTRNGKAAVLWEGEAGGRGVLVAGTAAPDVVELWDWRLGPGDEHASEPHSAGTKELMHVLTGRVVLQAADQTRVLATGDSAFYPGDVAHSYSNPSAKSARFSLSVYEPGVGTAHLRTEADHE